MDKRIEMLEAKSDMLTKFMLTYVLEALAFMVGSFNWMIVFWMIVLFIVPVSLAYSICSYSDYEQLRKEVKAQDK